MAARKSHMAPFWMMALLVIIVVGYYIYLFVTLKIIGSPQVMRYLVTTWSIEIVVLLAEAITYWFIRKWKMPKLFVWAHIGSSWFSFVLIPLVIGIIIVIISSMHSPNEFYSIGDTILKIRSVLFWTGVIIGHAFFIAAIVKGARNKESENGDEIEQAFT